MSNFFPLTFPIVWATPKIHNFFDKAVQTRIVIPGKVTVKSHPAQEESYEGFKQDANYDTYSEELQVEETIYMRLLSNEEAVDIATARLRGYQLESSRGQGSIPTLNLAQEVYDFIKFTDSRAGDTTTGIVLAIDEHIAPGIDDMTLSFGIDIKPFIDTFSDAPMSSQAMVENIITLKDICDRLIVAYERLSYVVKANKAIADASVYSVFLDRHAVPMFPIASTTVLTTGDITDFRFDVPVDLHGMDLIDVQATVITASTSGVPQIKIQISDDHGSNWTDMLSTDITIDQDEYRSEDAATPPVIDYSEVSQGDLIRIYVEVAGTNTAGLIIRTRFARV